MEPASRTKLVTAGVLALVFASGALTGYAAHRQLTPAVAEATEAVADRDWEEGRPHEARPRTFVYEQLDPTDAQQVRIDSIMRAQRGKMDWLRADFAEARRVYRENYDAVVQELREGIAGVFSADQAAEYRRLLAEYDRRRAEERENRDDRK